MSSNLPCPMHKLVNANRRAWLLRSAALGGSILATSWASTAQGTSPKPADKPDENRLAELAVLPGAKLLGQVPLRFFGLLIYDLSLWADTGFDLALYDRQAFALSLRYARALEGKAIAERSLKLMADLEPLDPVRAKAWLALMEQAFPDVVANDRITGAHDGKGGVRFWHNGRLTAQSQDPFFARLFFGIWLSPKTSAPALRESLLKVRNG